MKTILSSVAVATLLAVSPAIAVHAEDAAPAETPRYTARPSIAPRTAEPAARQAEAEPPPRHAYRHRYARRHYRHYAYWEPFPTYWPHLYHSRVYWNRVPWFSF